MKKMLYIAPAFVVCMFIGTLGLLFGFGEFEILTWGYVLCSLMGTVLLCKGKWWGGLVGAIMGALIIWKDLASFDTGVRTWDLGIFFLLYYLVMAIVCYRSGKK